MASCGSSKSYDRHWDVIDPSCTQKQHMRRRRSHAGPTSHSISSPATSRAVSMPAPTTSASTPCARPGATRFRRRGCAARRCCRGSLRGRSDADTGHRKARCVFSFSKPSCSITSNGPPRAASPPPHVLRILTLPPDSRLLSPCLPTRTRSTPG